MISHYEEFYADLKKQNQIKHDLVVKGLKQNGDKSVDYDTLFKLEEEDSEGYGYENNTTSVQMRV